MTRFATWSEFQLKWTKFLLFYPSLLEPKFLMELHWNSDSIIIRLIRTGGWARNDGPHGIQFSRTWTRSGVTAGPEGIEAGTPSVKAEQTCIASMWHNKNASFCGVDVWWKHCDNCQKQRHLELSTDKGACETIRSSSGRCTRKTPAIICSCIAWGAIVLERFSKAPQRFCCAILLSNLQCFHLNRSSNFNFLVLKLHFHALS